MDLKNCDFKVNFTTLGSNATLGAKPVLEQSLNNMI